MMMRMFLIMLMTGSLAASSVAAAEVPATMGVRMVAEHQQWAADHENWHAEHLALAKPADAAALAAAHARLASDNDDARIAHHELVDDVRHIEMFLEDDRKTEANEAPSPR